MNLNRDRSQKFYEIKKIKLDLKHFFHVTAGAVALSISISGILSAPNFSSDKREAVDPNQITISNELTDETEVLYDSQYYQNYVQEKIDDATILNRFEELNSPELVLFVSLLNDLNSKGYTNEELKNLFNYLSQDDLMTINTYDYIENVSNYIIHDHFKVSNIDRYLAYQDKNNQMNEYDVMVFVNLGLDKNEYEDQGVVANPDDNLALVSRHFKLPSDYVPETLYMADSREPVLIPDLSRDNKGVKPEVHQAMWELYDHLISERGANAFRINYAFRSYEEQDEIYNRNYKNNPSFAKAYVAQAGNSEHQTGRAIDIEALSNYEDNYQYLSDIAHEYGFIIRYEQGKKAITGYNYEPWHITYVGKEAAKDIHDNDLTFEEYYATKVDVRTEAYNMNKYDVNQMVEDLNIMKQLLKGEDLLNIVYEKESQESVTKLITLLEKTDFLNYQNNGPTI